MQGNADGIYTGEVQPRLITKAHTAALQLAVSGAEL
jgi:hypothetical protein